MLKLKSLRTQRGDTILEVLIATAVLTLVLTIAYTAANRGTHSIRQSQERGESSRYTESQIELLKTYVSQTAAPALPASGTKFCMKNDGTPVAITAPIDNNAQNEDFSAFSSPALADCIKDGLYYNYIERNGDTFIAHTRWTRVNGKGIDEATMVHRIYPDLASGSISIATTSPGCPANHFYNAVGGCTPCPTGYTSPGGFSTACAPIPAQIQVIVEKIPPVGNSSPPCSNGGNAANGVPVRLNGSGGPYNGTSTALFDVAFSSTYTASIVTMPNGFELCSSPPPTTSTPIGTPPTPPGNNQQTMTFKIRPLCNTVAYGPPYYHVVYWHDHGYDYPVYGTAYWWQHTGPGWYYGGAPWYYPNPHYQWEPNSVAGGPSPVLARYAWPGSPANNNWRNRYELWSSQYIAGWAHYYDWHLHQEDYRGDPYMTCEP